MTLRLSRPRVVLPLVLAVLALLLPLGLVDAPAYAAASTPNPIPVYRFYKTIDGSHFFTTNPSERAQLLARPTAGYRYEGVAFYAYPTQVAGTQPVYRFYKFAQGVHFYTINPQEAAGLQQNAANVYRYEGVAWYASPTSAADTSPVYRFYKFKQGVHFYTASASEAAQLQANASSVYRFEGIAYYRPTKLRFSGTGDAESDTFVLPSGLVRFTTTTSDDAFVAALHEGSDPDDSSIAYLVDGEPAGTRSTADLYAEDDYYLNVATDGAWSVVADFPTDTVGARREWTGSASTATDLFTFFPGYESFTVEFTGPSSSYLSYRLVDARGGSQIVDFGPPGPAHTVSSIPVAYQNYLLDVYQQGPGTWKITASP